VILKENENGYCICQHHNAAFFKCCAMDIPVTGPMLQSKAKEIDQRLHTENSQASKG
jgi:hypothetical protein